MSLAAPNAVDSQELLFKVLCRLRIFPSQAGHFQSAVSVVAAAPKYGLIFIGTPNGFQILQSNKIADLTLSTRSECAEYPRREVFLNTAPSHLSVSCDQAHLAVGLVKDACPTAIIYDITTLCSKSISVISNIRLAATPGCFILDFHFNPGIPKIMAACTSDGGVGIYEIKDSGMGFSTLPQTTQATCLCWSPKGKQVVIGDKNGSLSQYKPDLKLVKSYPAPPDRTPSSAVNVLWVSNYQFVAIYANSTHPEERPCIMIVNVPKGGPVTYINYDDICFSAGEFRSPQFYLILQSVWNLLMVASANSMEVGVLALMQDQWQQITQEDASRAELPLTSNRQETYPVGMVLDTSSTRQLTWGENQSLQPMPLLHILSHDGVLCIYHVINILPGAAAICSPPEALVDLSGLDQFTCSQPPPLTVLPQPLDQSAQQPQLQSSPLAPVATSFPSSLASNQQASGGMRMFQSPTLGVQAFTSSVSAFSVSSVAPPVVAASSASGDGNQKDFGNLQTSHASLTFQPAPPCTPPLYSPSGSSQSHAVQQSAPPAKSLPALVPVPPVQTVASFKEVLQEEGVSSGAPEAADVKDEAIDPEMYIEHIQAEIRDFENELAKLRQRAAHNFVPVGSPEEKRLLLEKAESFCQFVEDLKETTKSQNTEITGLSALFLETCSWVEDAKSRQQQLNNPSYLQLIRAQKLDPASARHMSNIQHLLYYVESQLHDIDRHLDIQWGEFQDSVRDVKNRLYVPTMENLYQTMVKQNKILAKQRCILEDVTRRIASRKLRNSNRIPLISDTALACRSTWRQPQKNRPSIVNNGVKSETDLSSLAENLLEMKLLSKQSQESDLDNIVDLTSNLNISRFRCVLALQKRLSRKKENALRERVLQLPMVRIKPDRTPSDMGSPGGRPTVSFNSSVISMPSRKPKWAIKPKDVSARNAVEKSQLSQDHALNESYAETSDLKIVSVSGGVPFPTGEGDTVKNDASKLFKPAIVQNHSSNISKEIQKTAASITTTSTKTETPDSFLPSGLKTAVVKTLTTPSVPSDIAPAFTAPSQPEGRKSDAAKAIVSTHNKSELSNIFKLPSSEASKAFSFAPTTSTPKSSSKVPLASNQGSIGFSLASGSQGSKNPLSSLGSLVDKLNVSPAQLQAPPMLPKAVTEASASYPVPATAFAAPAVSKPIDTGISSSAPPLTPSSSSANFIRSNTSSTSSKQGLLPTPIKSESSAATHVSSVSTVTSSSFPAPPAPKLVSPAPASPAKSVSLAVVAPSTAATVLTTPTTVVSTASSASASPIAFKPAAPEGSSSLFGGIGLGGTPLAPNKPTASIFGGSAVQFGKTSGTALFSPPTSTTTATAVTSAAPPGAPVTSGSSGFPSGTAWFSLGSTSSTAPAAVSSTTSSGETSVFGQAPTTPPTTVPSSGASPASPLPLFGPTSSAVSITPVSSTFSFAPSTTSTIPGFGAASSSAPSSTFNFASAPSTATATTTSPSFSFTLPASTAGSSVTASKSFSFSAPAPAPSSTAPQPVFGSSLFGPISTSTSASTQPAFFGQPICSPSSTGQTTSIFGGGSPTVATAGFSQPATTAQSVFGQTPPAIAFGSKPAFGQSGGSLFGSTPGGSGFASTGTSIFGGGQAASAIVFGGGAAAPASGNLFQQAASSQPSVFGGASPASGSFSGGIGGTIGQTGFGSPNYQQRPQEFGGFATAAPAFGSPAAFGSPPAFGASPTFGGAPAFGSPPKVFGATASPGFGAVPAASANSTFEALAAQDSGMTFGNLAQGGQQAAPPTLFGGSPSPPFGSTSSTSFGGTSFSSWR